jgi:hypothetical protein
MRRLISISLLTVVLAACTGSVTQNDPVYDFTASGSLVRNMPGLTPGVWYLQYDKDGQTDLTTRLSFDDETICIDSQQESACERNVFEQGLQVTIEGNNEGGGVLVREMSITQ